MTIYIGIDPSSYFASGVSEAHLKVKQADAKRCNVAKFGCYEPWLTGEDGECGGV